MSALLTCPLRETAKNGLGSAFLLVVVEFAHRQVSTFITLAANGGTSWVLLTPRFSLTTARSGPRRRRPRWPGASTDVPGLRHVLLAAAEAALGRGALGP